MKSGTPLQNLFFSSQSDVFLRPGTAPTPLIVGFAKALESADRGRSQRVEKVSSLRDFFIDELKSKTDGVINGSTKHRVANNISVSFPGVNHEYLRVLLDTRGICVSTGSACVSGEEEVRSVNALGANQNSALRFSLGEEATKEEITTTVEMLVDILKKGLV